MHDNTLTTKNGRQPVMGGNAAFIWNLRMMLMLAMLACPILSAADEAQPFDCTMPIIMEPIILRLHKTIRPREGELDKRHSFEGKPTKFVFEISSRPLTNEEKKLFDKLMTISYKEPDNQFVIYAKDGFVLKIEHIDEFGKSHVYRQTLPDRLQKMDFGNKEYLKLSRARMQDVFKGEFPFMDWNTGKYEALVNSSFTNDKPDMKNCNGMLDITFGSPRLECKLSYISGKLYNACYIRSMSDKQPFLGIYHTFTYGANGNLVMGNYLDATKQFARDMYFHDDMGLRMLAELQGRRYKRIVLWSKQGTESTSLSHDEWQKLGMPNDYDEWKKRSPK